MPSALESLAAFTQDPALASHSASRMEALRLHIADTLGMMLQGALLAEGRAAMALGCRLAGWCACARLTEADDIHLTSCTRPGSVVIPTALHLASAGAFKTWGDFVTAVLAGYETLILVGYAINGPRILASKVWPTLFGARQHSTRGYPESAALERRIVEGHTSPPRACRYPQNQVARTHSSPGSWRIAVAKGRYDAMRRSLIRLPPRIASLSALLRKGALRTKSMPIGQSKG